MEKKTIILGVTGGIAAYKSAGIASYLIKRGHDVHVIMTKNATEFIAPLTFETLTNNRVSVGVFDRNFQYDVNHVEIAKKADLFVVAPATANAIAKFATGIADDMLSTTFLACRAPKLIAPAMNTAMLENPITERNIEMLKELGIYFIDAASGLLACGDVGTGKLADIDDIHEMIDYLLEQEKPLAGKTVVVTAGPTTEPLDPVRFITNHSSGKMGYELARAARNLGANVHLISGPTNLRPPLGVDITQVSTAGAMFEIAMKLSQDYDIFIGAAAVSDFRPKKVFLNKLKKSTHDLSSLKMQENPDIVASVAKTSSSDQIVCAFAMETENLIENARTKLISKNVDIIVANDLSDQGAGFKSDDNRVTIITRDEQFQLDLMSKQSVAYKIMDKLINMVM